MSVRRTHAEDCAEAAVQLLRAVKRVPQHRQATGASASVTVAAVGVAVVAQPAACRWGCPVCWLGSLAAVGQPLQQARLDRSARRVLAAQRGSSDYR